MIGFPWSLYLYIQYFVDVDLQTINIRVNQKKIKRSREEYVMLTCFKFGPMKNSF